MSKLKNKLLRIKQKWIVALPTILVCIFLLFTIWHLFGAHYIILSSVLALLFRTKHMQDFRLKELLRVYVIMIGVYFSSFFATRSLFLCVFLNLLVPFLLVYLLTNKFNPKAYYVYVMEFVFLQLLPINWNQIPYQLGALIYGLLVVTIALYIHSKIIKRKRHYGTIRKGMKNLSLQLEKLVNNEDFSEERNALVEMMYHMNQVIYSSRKYSYLTTGYGKINYWFMLIFQRFNYFIANFVKNELTLNEDDKAYFLKLSTIFASVETQLNTIDNHKILESINEFLSIDHLSSKKSEDAMFEILSLLKCALSDLENVSMNKAEKSWYIPETSKTSRKLKEILKLDLFHIRFALRLSVVLCISFTFCFVTKLGHSYWYPMSAFLMIMPYEEESISKVSNRIVGTIIGLCIVFCLMEIFHGLAASIVIIVIMICFMYYVQPSSIPMSMCSTCYGLMLALMSIDLKVAIELRLIYVCVAAVTTLLANHFLFPNTIKGEFLKSINELFDVDIKMIKELEKSCKYTADINVFRDLIIHSNLLSQEIQDYINKNMDTKEKEIYSHLIPINQKLIIEMEQLREYIFSRGKNINSDDNFLLQEIFRNFNESIQLIRLGYTTNELNSSIETNKDFQTFGKLDEKLYFNTLAFNCINTINQLKKLHNKIPNSH